MDNLIFPELAKKQFDIECNNIIEQERQRLAQRERQIKIKCLKNNFLSFKSGYFWVALGLVLILPFVVAPGPVVLPMLLLTIGVVLFLLRDKIKQKGVERKIIKANKLIEEERRNFEKTVENIRQEYSLRILEYAKQFEQEAQALSVNYTESAVAVDVINWMTEGFCKTIDSADRRSHIEEISVPFVFRTYRNKIQCQLGVYDFEINRCVELQKHLDQAALSRAIASAVQLSIAIKYPQDITGTDVVINVDYSYSDDHALATMIYIARNGDYKSAREWK